ncbi:MAG: PEP/pyruvate-binding domain-containing protein [Longimicrobiales bacterium]
MSEVPAKSKDHDKAETLKHLTGYLEAYPGLRGRVCRILLLHLHSQGYVSVDEIYRRAERAEEWNRPMDPNRPSARLWAADEKESINRIVIDLASEWLTPDQVDEIVWDAHRRDEAKSLETPARMPDVSLDLLADKVTQYASFAATAKTPGVRDATVGTRVALIRRVISDRVDYISVAKQYLRIRDVANILNHAVSAERGSGKVGGKAAGMLLAWAVLRDQEHGPVQLPETLFVLTDAYQEFKEVNGLIHLEDHKYAPIEKVRKDYPAILEVFRNAEFAPRIMDLLRLELDRLGECPLIVRSSSVLEDNLGATFSGIYKSLFVANQGPLEKRLQELLGAIAEIYSGVFHPDAIQYRRSHQLLDSDERMAVMIQRVVGSRHGAYYLPRFAGVAFSRNDYRWSRRIRREDGLLRLVVGLGTRAVDRVGDYARMVPLNAPTLRPETTSEEIQRVSQKRVDVVDLVDPGFKAISSAVALDAMRDSGIAEIVSVREEDGRLSTPVSTKIVAPADDLLITFDNLLSRGEFTRRIRKILKALEKAYRCPVDLEFAVDDGKLHILQCRPLGARDRTTRASIPKDVPEKNKIFSAHKHVNSGRLRDVEYIVLVDPVAYGGLATIERRMEIARAVGRVNDALADYRFILMGPGRWGSQDILLGVQITYADISNANALVEIARTEGGFTPEPSFGTHFFQDLIEASILYLPLYPDLKGVVWNKAFLETSTNHLGRLSPRDEKLSDVVRVIHVCEAGGGRRMDLLLDGEEQEALCYLLDQE